MDVERIKEGFQAIVEEICGGKEKIPNGMVETPRRIAEMYNELFNCKEDPVKYIKLFDAGVDDVVAKIGIKYFSVCEHHFVPFHGRCHIGYLPSTDGKIIGISKLTRIVRHFAENPSTQEVLTNNIANFLYNQKDDRCDRKYNHDFKPQGVIVIMTGVHFCEVMRGARGYDDSPMVTSAVRGKFFTVTPLRQEFLKLIELVK